MSSLILMQNCGKMIQFYTQLCTFVLRWRWRNEWPRLERRLCEGAVKPETKLPSNLETTQCSTMIAGQRMARRVTRTPEFIKQLDNLTGQDSMILQSPQHVILRFLRRHEQSDS